LIVLIGLAFVLFTHKPAATQKITKPIKTAMSYKDQDIAIQVSKKRIDDSNVWLVDIKLTNPSYFKTFMAQNKFGSSITEKMSDMVKSSQAILAVNGDDYGMRTEGITLRNEKLYRALPSTAPEALYMDKGGNLGTLPDTNPSQNADDYKNYLNIWSFGPTLISNHQIQVTKNQTISFNSNSLYNPRTAIGQLGKCHYLILVADGRTSQNKGISLYQEAQIFKQENVSFAYNLDGGGSSELILNGKILNADSELAQFGYERALTDMIYIGYQNQKMSQ
jgi:exopolysaccharide biosynthesis protein